MQTRSICWVLALIHRHIINLSHTLKVIKSSYWCVCACVYWLTGWMGVYPLTAPLSLSLSLRREERAALPCPRAGFHQWYAADGKGGRGLWPDFHVFQGMSSWVHCPYHSAVLEVTLELRSTTRLTLNSGPGAESRCVSGIWNNRGSAWYLIWKIPQLYKKDIALRTLITCLLCDTKC